MAGMATLLGCVLTVRAQDRDSELTLLRGAAEDGDSAAQFTLANQYYRGLGVHQDYEKALALYVCFLKALVNGAHRDREAATRYAGSNVIVIQEMDDIESREPSKVKSSEQATRRG